MNIALKKAMSSLCAISILLSMVIVAQASGVKIKVDDKTLVQGTGTETVEVPLELSGNTGIAGMTLQISYDDGLELTAVTKGAALGSMNLTKDGNYLTANPFNLLWDGEVADTTNGVIATLTFKVPKNVAKTYQVSATLDSAFDGNVEDVNIAIVNGGITVTEAPKADFAGISLSNKTYTYDGVAKALTVSGTVPSGATVTYTYNDSTEKPTDAGTYAVKATVSKDGYNDLVLNSTMTINPKNITVSGMSASNKAYDGTTDATVSGGALSGKVAGDAVDATFPTTGTFTSANVGNNITVSVPAVTLSGADKDNYTLTQPTGLKANITKRPITVTARSYTIRQNATVPALEYDITSGSMVSGEALNGALSVNANGTSVGTFDITKGTLTAGNNYNMTFVKGTLTVSAKDAQNVTVANIPAKTYGDSAFALDVTDNSTVLGALAYESTNTDVATVSADGTVTVKAAGTTNIKVSRTGNDQYADFTVTKALTVNKKAITVTAKSYTIKQGNAVPALEYDITSGELVSGDAITGELAVNADGTALGEYDITQGTLTAGNNYTLTFVKGKLAVVDKTPQSIVVGVVGERTYGDAAFAVSVTPDETANLSAFSYASSNTDVAEIAADGTITIKAVGETDITVTEPGNGEYATFTNTQKLVVNKKGVTVTSVDLDAETAVIDGVLSADTDVALNFDKLNLEIIDAVDETTSNVKVTGFELTGEKAENYTVTTTELNSTIANDNVVTVTATADSGTVTGAGSYIKGSSVTVTATPSKEGYTFDGWYVDKGFTTAYDFSDIVTKNITIYAKWTANEPDAPEATDKPEAPAGGLFSDIKPDAWYYDSVKFVAEKGLMNGVTDTEFAPNNTLTRAMLVTILYRNDGEPEAETETVFKDVESGAYYEKAVAWAKAVGIVDGYTETMFAPDANITREQIAAIMHRYAEYKSYDVSKSAEIDARDDYSEISDYAVSAMQYVVGSGLLTGKTDTTLNPQDNATRAEIATILQRFITANN